MDLNRLLKISNLITLAFVALSTIAVAVFSLYLIMNLDRASVDVYRRLIDSFLKENYQSMSEETFFQLDTLDLHKNQLQGLIEDRGEISLSFSKSDQPVKKNETIIWLENQSRYSDQGYIDLYFGDEYLGRLAIKIKWLKTFATEQGKRAILSLALIIFGLLAVAAISLLFLRFRIFKPMLHSITDLQNFKVIAKTAQMLAHDIRRPFTVMKMSSKILSEMSNPDKIRAFAKKVAPEVEKSIASVNVMLDEILIFGSQKKLKCSPHSLTELINEVLKEAKIIHPNHKLTISCQFYHRHLIECDVIKLKRAIANVVHNAFEAAPPHGSIWIKTQSLDNNQLSLVVGNSGSYIAVCDRGNVFKSFYSSGKKNGTGLGLAITKQIIENQGGTVSCHSSQKWGTEFTFVLNHCDLLDPVLGHSKSQHSVETPLSKKLPTVVLVDDCVFINEVWAEKLRDVNFYSFTSPDEFWRAYKAKSVPTDIDCFIVDYHFGDKAPQNGVEFAEALKQRFLGPILLCTDYDSKLLPIKNFDGTITKDPVSWQEINRNLRSGAS